MSNQEYNTILVTGIDSGSDRDHINMAWNKARELFEDDLVSPLTEVGHNFVRSFCIFPSGSGSGRISQLKHKEGIIAMAEFLSNTDLEWVNTYWSDSHAPSIVDSHCS